MNAFCDKITTWGIFRVALWTLLQTNYYYSNWNHVHQNNLVNGNTRKNLKILETLGRCQLCLKKKKLRIIIMHLQRNVVNTSLAVSRMANQITRMQQKRPFLDNRKRSTKVHQFMTSLPFRKFVYLQTPKIAKNYQNDDENNKARKILKTMLFIDRGVGIRIPEAFKDFKIIVRIPNFWETFFIC